MRSNSQAFGLDVHFFEVIESHTVLDASMGIPITRQFQITETVQLSQRCDATISDVSINVDVVKNAEAALGSPPRSIDAQARTVG